MTPAEWIPPSGSKLQVGEGCPASMALPRFKEEAGEPAEIGTGVHAFVEAVAYGLKTGRDLDESRTTALEAIPEDASWRDRCECLDLERLDLRADSLHEVGFRFDPASGAVTLLGAGLKHGDVERVPGMIDGVFDRVTDRPDLDLVEVDDWKTGRLPVPVKDNLQLLLGAMCAAKHFGRSKARISIVKIPEDGRPRHEIDELGAFDLDMAAARLSTLVDTGREQARRLGAGEALDYVQGEGCRYCPSFNACVPSMRAIVVMAREPLNIESEITGLIATGTDEDARKAYEAFARWDTVAKRIRLALLLRARNTPIPFEDGTVYGEREYQKTKLDGEKVFAVMTAEVGAFAAALCVKKKATKKGIRAAAKFITEKRKSEGDKKAKIGAAEIELGDMLEAKGASIQETKRKLDRHKPGEAAKDDDDE